MAPLVIIFTYINFFASFQCCLTGFWSKTIILICIYILLFTSDHKHPIFNTEWDSQIYLHVTSHLSTLRAVMIITTLRRYLSWWHLEVLAIPQLSPCYPLSTGRSWHTVLYVKGHWGEGTAGAWPAATAALCPFHLSVDHFTGSALLDGWWMHHTYPPFCLYTQRLPGLPSEMVGFWKHQVQLLGPLVGETFASWAR